MSDHEKLLSKAEGARAALSREPAAWWDEEHVLDNGYAAVVIRDLAAALRAVEAERDDLATEPRVVACNCYPLPCDHDDDSPLAQGGDLSQCDYYNGKGTCTFGCYDEPQCMTCRPAGGWPLEQMRAERDALRSVVRRVHWPEMDEWSWSPAEAEAIARAREEP